MSALHWTALDLTLASADELTFGFELRSWKRSAGESQREREARIGPRVIIIVLAATLIAPFAARTSANGGRAKLDHMRSHARREHRFHICSTFVGLSLIAVGTRELVTDCLPSACVRLCVCLFPTPSAQLGRYVNKAPSRNNKCNRAADASLPPIEPESCRQVSRLQLAGSSAYARPPRPIVRRASCSGGPPNRKCNRVGHSIRSAAAFAYELGANLITRRAKAAHEPPLCIRN